MGSTTTSAAPVDFTQPECMCGALCEGLAPQTIRQRALANLLGIKARQRGAEHVGQHHMARLVAHGVGVHFRGAEAVEEAAGKAAGDHRQRAGVMGVIDGARVADLFQPRRDIGKCRIPGDGFENAHRPFCPRGAAEPTGASRHRGTRRYRQWRISRRAFLGRRDGRGRPSHSGSRHPAPAPTCRRHHSNRAGMWF